MHKTPRYFISIFIVIGQLVSSKGYCENVNGRFTFGGYTATERFTDSSGTGSDKNDFQTLSARFFLNVEKISKSDWQTTVDLRDKHDFFDKLDAERLQLSSKNEFQVRQLSVKNSETERFWGVQLGRFAVLEAGAAFTDGLQVENHWNREWTSSLFAGLNPKRDDQSYTAYNSEAEIRGGTLTYQRSTKSWNENFYSTQALVEKATHGEANRRYFFNNLNYQWSQNSRVITLLYYDFLTRSFIQNGNLIWQQGWSDYFQTEANAFVIDAIEYDRRKNVLEALPASPYREGSLKFNLNLGKTSGRIHLRAQSGEREVDQKKRTAVEIGFIKTGLFGPQWDIYGTLGAQKNFVSEDQIARFGLGYFSRKWEWSLDAQSQIQKNDNGTTSRPIILESSLANYVSRNTYLTLAGQYAKDERVTILGAFFRVGYRFGSREIPPLRDGAPPRGPL
ncbi:MAG: hypothetical protein AB7O96_17260 [Pseudobdellovibrionaceae bacterium]